MNAAALIAAARALSWLARLRLEFAAKNRASVAPIAAAPSAVTAVPRPTTLCSHEPFGSRIRRLEVG